MLGMGDFKQCRLMGMPAILLLGILVLRLSKQSWNYVSLQENNVYDKWPVNSLLLKMDILKGEAVSKKNIVFGLRYFLLLCDAMLSGRNLTTFRWNVASIFEVEDFLSIHLTMMCIVFSVVLKTISRFSEIWNLSPRLHDVASKNTIMFVVTDGVLWKPFNNSGILLYVMESLYLPTATVTVQAPRIALLRRGSG